MKTVRAFADVREHLTGTVALVPTMGYLHEGHLALIEHASKNADTTVVSLFVNPTQFGDPTDLETYPVDEARDADLAARAGATVLFAPDVEEVYPTGELVTVSVGAVGDVLEGEFRPGHFAGVATVVAKLLAGVQPDVAWFGRKDAQQLAVVQAMARSLRFPTAIRGLPTIREADGLALSSRNRRLTVDERAAAVALSRSLFAAADAVEAGERQSQTILAAASEELAGEPRLTVEYAAVADARTGLPVEEIQRDAFVAVAARVGDVRLIDNVGVDGDSLSVDRGIRLSEPSILYREV